MQTIGRAYKKLNNILNKLLKLVKSRVLGNVVAIEA